MPLLTTAAALVVAAQLRPTDREFAPRWTPPRSAVWYDLAAEPGWAPGGLGLRGVVGYDGPLSVSVSIGYDRAPGLPSPATLSLQAGRSLDGRHRVDVQVWRGMNRAGGGVGLGLTVRRTLGRSG